MPVEHRSIPKKMCCCLLWAGHYWMRVRDKIAGMQRIRSSARNEREPTCGRQSAADCRSKGYSLHSSTRRLYPLILSHTHWMPIGVFWAMALDVGGVAYFFLIFHLKDWEN